MFSVLSWLSFAVSVVVMFFTLVDLVTMAQGGTGNFFYVTPMLLIATFFMLLALFFQREAG